MRSQRLFHRRAALVRVDAAEGAVAERQHQAPQGPGHVLNGIATADVAAPDHAGKDALGGHHASPDRLEDGAAGSMALFADLGDLEVDLADAEVIADGDVSEVDANGGDILGELAGLEGLTALVGEPRDGLL